MIKKINLTLLKKLVEELEISLLAADGIKKSTGSDNNDYVIELSKSIGLCSGVALEAEALISDITNNVNFSQTSPSKMELLNKLFSPAKSPKGGN